MKIKHITYIGLLSFFISFTSCNDIDLSPSQENAVDIGNAITDIESAQTAVNGLYDLLYRRDYYGRELMVTPEVSADNILVSPTNSGRYLRQYQYSVLPTDGAVGGLWNNLYKNINGANTIIFYIESGNISNGTTVELNEAKGHAFAIRGMAHFDLVRTYAFPYTTTSASASANANGQGGHLGVPLLTTFEAERHAPRATVAEVYTQVITDLTTAMSLLPSAAYNKSSQFNKTAIKALLARVYLYKGDYANAYTMANQVIGDAQYSLTSNVNYMNDWNGTGSSEAILQLPAFGNDHNGFDSLGSIYIPNGDDGNGGYGDLIPTTDIMDLYSANDVRTGWFRNLSGTIYNYKFPNSFTSYIPLLRLSEMYLIVAESVGNGAGTSIAGQNALNAIILRANPSATPTTSIGSTLLAETLVERRKELAFEGHRMYDIVRNQANVMRTDIASPSTISTITYPDFRMIWPISQNEIDANNNINENNTGY